MSAITPFFLIASLLAVNCCNHNGPDDVAPQGSCAPHSQTVKTVADAEGIVGFNTTSQQYYISKHEPGTYDVVDLGVVCGALPGDLQTTGLPVVFSGDYKEYAPQPVLPAGYTYYYLELSKIARK